MSTKEVECSEINSEDPKKRVKKRERERPHIALSPPDTENVKKKIRREKAIKKTKKKKKKKKKGKKAKEIQKKCKPHFSVLSKTEEAENCIFFCDGCEKPIPLHQSRFDCPICDDDYCYCAICFATKDHEHTMYMMTGKEHLSAQVMSEYFAMNPLRQPPSNTSVYRMRLLHIFL